VLPDTSENDRNATVSSCSAQYQNAPQVVVK
jgi:hypothetical protein